jgi:nitrous oxide reductase accessory protein NosL
MIKRLLVLFSIVIFSSVLIQAEPFSKMATTKPILVQEGAKKHWCAICGMSLKMFYKTSHAVDKKQFCSLRCLVVDMQESNISLNSIKVVDAKTEKLIPAKEAFYVVGSKIMGTMSKVSKLAFASKEDAEQFAKEHKGKVVSFDEALAMAKESLDSDVAMVMKKKQKKIYPMGKKLFEAKCQQDIKLSEYRQINELKSAIKKDKLCKDIKGKRFQAVALYLWEVKRAKVLAKNGEAIEINKDDKCPVCGMFVYKYPKWVAQIYYGDTLYSFDGVKDMMKFYFEPKKWGKYENKKENITKILVTDYYSQKVIDGTKAYFVIGSDVAGPMGNELIPFEQESDAKTFSSDHNGKSIVRFDKIVEKEVYKLDE